MSSPTGTSPIPIELQEETRRLLTALAEGDRSAFDDLFARVYDELRAIAHGHLARERAGHTLNTTALVHEAYMSLAGGSAEYQDRAHFFAVASRAMRNVLVDYARGRAAAKRGGERVQIELRDDLTVLKSRVAELIELDDALTRLEQRDERLGRIVEYRFFGGMSVPETAAALGVSSRTVERDWTRARSYLFSALRG